MDPFEVRMQFLAQLKRLDATQQSIRKIVTYALKYYSRCGEDLWDCLVEECQKGSINTRINILYLLDTLCETSLLTKAHAGEIGSNGTGGGSYYVDFVARDLSRIVDYVVPDSREGLLNLLSATQILDNWRSKRLIDPQKVDEILSRLNNRKSINDLSPSSPSQLSSSRHHHNSNSSAFSRHEIVKRIEEDRERHKRLRERRWVQPISYNKDGYGGSILSLPGLACFMPEIDVDVDEEGYSNRDRDGGNSDVDMDGGTGDISKTGGIGGGGEATMDIEFDNEWETTSDWNEDDDDAVAEENELCFGTVSPIR